MYACGGAYKAEQQRFTFTRRNILKYVKNFGDAKRFTSSSTHRIDLHLSA